MTAAHTAPISRFPVPALEDLPEDIRERIATVQEKSGFIPNVFLTLAHRPDEFRAFMAYHDALMDKPGNLSKAEREMIVVATSSVNQCQYCVIAHGAILRIRAKDPLIADQVATNYRKADITARQKAMLDFAMKVSQAAQGGRSGLRRAQVARLRRRRRVGHHGDLGFLRHVQPHRERDEHAAECGVLRAGALSARDARGRGARAPPSGCGRRRPRPASAPHRPPRRNARACAIGSLFSPPT